MHALDGCTRSAQGEPLLRSDCAGLTLLRRGTVKDVYDLGDVLLLVSTDRMPADGIGIEQGFHGKGVVVNQLSAHWFRKLRGVFPNHLVSATPKCFPASITGYPEVVDGRAMLVWKALSLPIVCGVRGYLTGAAWHEYLETGAVCGKKLPAAMVESQRLPAPIFAASVKGEAGESCDIDFRGLQRLIGDTLANHLRDAALRLYFSAWKSARERGVLIANTKFEFGLHDGKLVLIDECLTPDTSRFWALESYRPGGAVPGLGKVRAEYISSLSGDSPYVPKDFRTRVGERYREAYKRIVGKRCEEMFVNVALKGA